MAVTTVTQTEMLAHKKREPVSLDKAHDTAPSARSLGGVRSRNKRLCICQMGKKGVSNKMWCLKLPLVLSFNVIERGQGCLSAVLKDLR